MTDAVLSLPEAEAADAELTAYLPVRVAEERRNGSVMVYLSDGTALTVRRRDLLRIDPPDVQSPGGR